MKFDSKMSFISQTDQENLVSTKSYKSYFMVVMFLYLILVLTGIHTSSVGILSGERIRDSPTYYGQAQPIRSDEYLRSTPILLGDIKSRENSSTLTKTTRTTPFDSNYPDKFLSGDLDRSQSAVLNITNIYSGILNFDDRLLSPLPLENEFVARWWLNSLYLFLGLGFFFRALKMSWKYALYSSLLVWLSTPNQWWSLWPVQSLGPASLAAGLFLSALLVMDEQIVSGIRTKLQFVRDGILPLFVAAIFAIRLPSTYQPWSIPTAVFFTCLTVGALWRAQISIQTTKKIIVPFLLFSGICAIPLIIRLSHSVSKLMKTVYPGSRRFAGFTDFPHWSGPASWEFQNVSGAVVNQSEFAIGVILFIPIAVAAILLRPKRRDIRNTLWFPLAFGCAPLTFFLIWIIAPWPKEASGFLLMSRFPPERIMQILGVLAPIIFVISIAYWREEKREKVSEKNYVALLGFSAFLLTLQGTVSLKQKLLGDLSLWSIWLTALLTAFAISLSFTQKYWRAGLTVVLAAALFSVANVNPIVRGQGIFGRSAAMEALQSAQSLNQGRWASDNYMFDSVPTGGGMRLLSGSQGSGPNLSAYHLLDPNDSSIGIWNRAGSYVFFNWTTGPEIGFVNPSFDVVAIQIDPCNDVLNQFDLSWVVSSNDLSSHKCLRYYQNIIFQGTRFNVYQRT